MVFVKLDGGTYSKENKDTFTIDNLDFIILNFNIIQDEIKLFIDSIIIEDDNIKLLRGNLLVSSINISDVMVTRVLSTIPLNKEVSGLILNELRYEYIVSFKQFNSRYNKNRLNHMYLIDRNPIDYKYTKK